MTRKEKFYALLTKHGYPSLNSFCLKHGFTQTNLNNRINSETRLVELPILFQLADALHEPIETLIAIFYPAELKKNRAACKKADK